MRTSLSALALVATCGLCAGAAMAERPQYTVRVVPVPVGFTSVGGLGLNDAGHVVGSALIWGTGTRPFLWDGQQTTILEHSIGTYHEATSINNAGQIAGHSQTQGWYAPHAMRWDAPDYQMQDLAPTNAELGDDLNSYAYAINDQGYVAGQIENFTDPSGHEPFLWTPEAGLVRLGSLGGWYAHAEDLSDGENPYVVGMSWNTQGIEAAFIWHEGVMTELPQLPGPFPMASAVAVNNNGQVAGSVVTMPYEDQFAAVWDDGVLRVLPLPEGALAWGVDINDAGDVVGDIGSFPANNYAVIWRGDTYYRDLNELIPSVPGRVLTAAHAINNAGQILVEGNDSGQARSFLLTPACPADANFDGQVNGIDVGAFLSAYAAQNEVADMNGDGQFNGVDVGLFLSAYAGGC